MGAAGRGRVVVLPAYLRQAAVGQSWGLDMVVPRECSAQRHHESTAHNGMPGLRPCWRPSPLLAPVANCAPTCPYPAQMLVDGKRLLLVSGTDYGQAMQPLLFSRDQTTLCGWNEPPLRAVDGVPTCQVTPQGGAQEVWSGQGGAGWGLDGQRWLLYGAGPIGCTQCAVSWRCCFTVSCLAPSRHPYLPATRHAPAPCHSPTLPAPSRSLVRSLTACSRGC